MALEKELRIQELNTSGSKGIKSIDPYGRHNYFAEQMKEVNGSMDGEVSGKLRRPKYDEDQLLLAVDTIVDELIGDKPKDLPDVVLRSEYEDVLAQLNACLAREADLRRQLADAQAKISELQAEIDGLKVRLDSSELRIAVAENSSEAAADKFAQTSIDLQQAIQKSVAEAIERVSLEAQVEGLTAQKEALVQAYSKLEEQYQGKSNELAQGADSSAGGSSSGAFTARVATVTQEGGEHKDLDYITTKKSAKSKKFKSYNGPGVVLLNTSEEPIAFTFTSSDKWLKAPAGTTINSGETKTVDFIPDMGVMKGKRPTGIGKARHYHAQVTIKGGGETVTFAAHIRKNRKGTV